MQEDADKWKQRPLPQHLIEGAVFNVCHLINLRLVLIEGLLSPVTIGTNFYLKEISSLSNEAIPGKLVSINLPIAVFTVITVIFLVFQASSHLIPESFKELAKYRTTGACGTFRNEVSRESLDPYVEFSRNIPHVRSKFYE